MAAMDWFELPFQRRARYYRLTAAAVPRMKAAAPGDSKAVIAAMEAAGKAFGAMRDWIIGAPDKRVRNDPDLVVIFALLLAYEMRAVEVVAVGGASPSRPPGEVEALETSAVLLAGDHQLLYRILDKLGVAATLQQAANAAAPSGADTVFTGKRRFNALWMECVHPGLKPPFADA